MSENSNFNSVIKVRRLVKTGLLIYLKSFEYICEGVKEFPKNEMLFFSRILICSLKF